MRNSMTDLAHFDAAEAHSGRLQCKIPVRSAIMPGEATGSTGCEIG
jgi:hypothetical protein